MFLERAAVAQPIARAPHADDARAIAELIAIAGDQPPEFPWGGGDGFEPAKAVADIAEAFCVAHASMLEIWGQVAGMVMGFRLPPVADTAALAALPDCARPLSALSTRQAASFYVSTFALYPNYQNHGFGPILLMEAERMARAARCSCVLLEVSEKNDLACRFYKRHGFQCWPERGYYEGVDGNVRYVVAVLEKPLET